MGAKQSSEMKKAIAYVKKGYRVPEAARLAGVLASSLYRLLKYKKI